MAQSLLATDGYKFSMAEAGWPLRTETFYYSHRKGGPQVLPVDVPAFLRSLLRRPADDDYRYLAEHSYEMVPGSDGHSAFQGLFSNGWLWGAVLLSLALQVAVIYIPFLQQAFSTASLSAADWLQCAAVGSSALWRRELSKVARRSWHE